LADVLGKVVFGTFFHAPVPGAVEVLEDALFDVGAGGVIDAVLLPADGDGALVLENDPVLEEDQLLELHQRWKRHCVIDQKHHRMDAAAAHANRRIDIDRVSSPLKFETLHPARG
jgi:hypothetical protein